MIRAVAFVRRRSAVLALALLVVVSAVVRFAASARFEIPWISPDEEIYALLGRSFWEHGSFSILGESAPYYSFLYPALAGLPLALWGVKSGLEALQLLQAVVMSSAAVPVFFWGRTLMRPRWALAAATLTVLVPALAYSGLAMSESLFYPLSLWALWALARTLERPTVARQAVFGLAVAGALATRLQAIVLVPVLVGSVGLLALFERRKGVVRPFLPVFAGIALLVVAWVTLNVVGGGSWRALLGAYATVGERNYAVGRSLSFVEWHVADLFLLTVGFPLLAFIALLVSALAGREPEPRVRAFLAATLAYVALLAVEVGLFASRFVGHLAERQLVTVAPPLFLALALWVHRGAPRPQPWTSIAAGIVAGPVILLPVRVLSNELTAHNAFMTIPLAKLQEHTSATTLQTAYVVGAALVVAVFVLLPARAAPVLIALVAVGLVGAPSLRRGRSNASRDSSEPVSSVTPIPPGSTRPCGARSRCSTPETARGPTSGSTFSGTNESRESSVDRNCRCRGPSPRAPSRPTATAACSPTTPLRSTPTSSSRPQVSSFAASGWSSCPHRSTRPGSCSGAWSIPCACRSGQRA